MFYPCDKKTEKSTDALGLMSGMYPQGRPVRTRSPKIFRYLDPIPTRGGMLLGPFLVIFLQTTSISFTKIRFRRSF